MSALERNFGYNVYQFEFKFLPNIKAKLSAKLRSCQSSQSMSQHVLFNVSVQAGSQLGKTGDKFEWSRGRRRSRREVEAGEGEWWNRAGSLAKWEDFISCVLFLKLILGNCLAACTNTHTHIHIYIIHRRRLT